MRTVLIFVLGLLLGAGLFHAYYLGQGPAKRCGWDHPFDDRAKSTCVATAEAVGYGKAARQELNDLVGQVSR